MKSTGLFIWSWFSTALSRNRKEILLKSIFIAFCFVPLYMISFICNTDYPDADDALGHIVQGEEGGACVVIGVCSSTDVSSGPYRSVHEEDSYTNTTIKA